MKLTYQQRSTLIQKGIANGCGRKRGFSFSKFIRFLIRMLPFYLQEKAESLFDYIEGEICFDHDIEYHLGGWFIAKFLADYKFCKRLYYKLHWTFLPFRLLIIIIIFIGLSIVGHLAFNYGKKRNINSLF